MKLSKNNKFKLISINCKNIKWANLVPYIIILLLVIIIGIRQPNAISLNYLGIKTDALLALIFATVGQTLVLMSGGFDLSIGGIISLTNSLAAVAMHNSLGSIFGISFAVILIGAILGLINGLIITKLRLHPFIATLITWSIYGGAALWILPSDGGSVPESFVKSLLLRVGNIPLSLIIILLLAGIWLYLKVTPFGIAIFAIGSNEKSVYSNGINVDAVKIKVYTLSGFLAGCAGLFRTAQVASGSPTAGNGFILISVAAAVIGGTVLGGGKGTIIGSIIGVFILKLIGDLLIFTGASSNWTALLQGLLLIISIIGLSIVDLIRHSREGIL